MEALRPPRPDDSERAPRAPRGRAVLREAAWTPAGLARRLPVDAAAVGAVARRFRLRVPHHYLSLVGTPEDPIGRQAVPTAAELAESEREADFLAEDAPAYSPVPHLTHRYPDRVLLLVTDACPMFCRFCMRKRKTLAGGGVSSATVARGLDYVRRTPAVREVILSGGDPLMLPERRLDRILAGVRAIAHVERVRLHTRMPCVEPGRITGELAGVLGRHGPLHVAVHFNHPREVTPEAGRALRTLARAGLVLHNQAVLLRGVNDDAAVLAGLFRRLLRLGVHPYYLHHSDLVPGTAHFRVPVQTGRVIVARLRALAPELGTLHYVLDTPGGGGKVPLG